MRLRNILFLVLSSLALEAAPIFTLPNGGLFSANPGQTLNIGFRVQSDTQSYVVINIVDGSATNIGPLVDVLSNYVSAQLYAYAPNAVDWTESFTPGLPLGPFPGALATLFVPIGTSSGIYSAMVQIDYSLFNLDPFIDVNAVDQGPGSVTLNFQVNVQPLSEVPEPAMLWPVGLGLAYLWRRGYVPPPIRRAGS